MSSEAPEEDIQAPVEASSPKALIRNGQCCGSALVSMRIRIQHFRSMRIRIQGFDDQNLQNISVVKKVQIILIKIAF